MTDLDKLIVKVDESLLRLYNVPFTDTRIDGAIVLLKEVSDYLRSLVGKDNG